MIDANTCISLHMTLPDGGNCFHAMNTEFELEFEGIDSEVLHQLLSEFDGNKSIRTIAKIFPELGEETIVDMVQSLDDSKLVSSCNSASQYVSGIEALMEIEDIQSKLLYETLYNNHFWKACLNPENVPVSIFHGMAVENYHFLFRESWFDSPVLSYQGSTKARLLINEFYAEEYGHDELILKALNELGCTRSDLAETIPLPETLALCNALAHWASNDPLFFFTTLGVLEGKDIKIDSYVLAMESRPDIPEGFIKPIRDHALINLNGEHGALTREIFKEIPLVTQEDMTRFRRETHLFVELYDDFHSAVWKYYSNPNMPLLRRLSEV
ncbi:iron-containing redox enzyme family protein [Enterovibrio sp. ZSDZ42]|uniref:Iron-containing redox enzyme family protein n=1 Tax=Enterovibrio gelatinilyticus TaxID=2899819 RepID=A0ABT5QVV0_9GAMM|nr:iron-containing redox enzyme family protein [Enterovibrio sp. ZSDZ42]MDD1791725.1 iron-containing redox enzyme family protein [Enterovibrio sp. ZSDZ42]